MPLPNRSTSPWRRRLLWLAGFLMLPVLWKLAWAYGSLVLTNPDGTKPALFPFKAKALILAQRGYPRKLELTLPPPAPLTSADAQLRLMGYWDGKAWTAKAAALGRVDGRNLLVDAGTLDLDDIVRVGPAFKLAADPAPEGTRSRSTDPASPAIPSPQTRAEVTYRLRWTFNPALQELYRHRPIVTFHPPRGLNLDAPGKTLVQKAVLLRRGLAWDVEPDPAMDRRPEVGIRSQKWSWLPMIF